MSTNPILSSIEIRDIEAHWDDEGIFVYQAYNQEIAQWALQSCLFRPFLSGETDRPIFC